jgi:hypothetical protein
VPPQDVQEALMSVFAVIAILFFIIFLAGTVIGVFTIAAWASNKEDRKKSLKGPPPGNGCGGARWLNGVGRRDTRSTATTQRPDEQVRR